MKRLVLEGSVPSQPERELMLSVEHIEAQSDPDLLTEHNVVTRILNETGETVHMMLRGDRCLLTGWVRRRTLSESTRFLRDSVCSFRPM